MMENSSSLSDKSVITADPAGARWIRRSSSASLSLRLLITIPVFGLFMEWLLPLQGLGSENGQTMLETLSILAVILLMQGLFTIREWVWFPINFVAVLLLWGRLFGTEDSFFWFLKYVSDVLPQDMNVLADRWLFSDLSDETRALVLILGWGVMVSAVHMLSLYRGTIWLFGGTTIVYLAVMEAMLENPVRDNMFRAGCYILIAQGLMLLFRLRDEEGSGSVKRSIKSKLGVNILLGWSAGVLILTIAVAILMRAGGEFLPARSASGFTIFAMADKFQEWSSGMSNRKINAGTTLTGYDSLGSDMGGPLKLSRDPFFTAETPVSTYWRGESLNYYNGRRWSADMSKVNLVEIEEGSGSTRFETNNRADRITQKITLEAPPSSGLPLFSGGITSRIDEVNGIDGKKLGTVITADPESSSLRFKEHNPRVISYSLEANLQAPKERLQQGSLGTDPDSILKTNLQLPESLPQEVHDLAQTITAGASGRYEKAVAVESYLEQEYKYTLKTKVPPAGRDFTDHFLFDSKEGYCTHFATAMVVLLRTQGIPARYVMGFAPGEKIQGTEQAYLVTQGEAHAWVEVYFPKEGWVAFDPTPGFYGDLDGTSLLETATVGSTDNTFRLTEMMQTIRDTFRGWFSHTSMIIATIAIGLFLLAWIAVGVLKQRWNLSFKSLRSFATLTERDRLTLFSDRVWKRIEKRYGAMEPGITVKKYIQSLNIQNDKFREEIEMFASRWERVAYMKEPLSRTEKNHYLRQCRTIVKKRV
ncbi:transglutaminaseTgpA domain-containing protein [Paenibacillus sp. GCM10028914]|uniref:transglutaminase family protein n=1 Tax=Paenibacillus sp. GCM10028914 TaxID=3273416 RepID=UPI003609E8F1